MSGTGTDGGGERVEAALAPLERLPELPVREHAGAFEEVFAGLEAVLASVGEPGESQAR